METHENKVPVTDFEGNEWEFHDFSKEIFSWNNQKDYSSDKPADKPVEFVLRGSPAPTALAELINLLAYAVGCWAIYAVFTRFF